MKAFHYRVTIQALPAQDGGGYAAYVPDLPGCMSDGATPNEATRNVQGAILEWMATALQHGMSVPPPYGQNNHRPSEDR